MPALEALKVDSNRGKSLWTSSVKFSTWNADQNLKTALRNFVNWYFQLLDGFSGAVQLKQFYTGIDYENSYIGYDTDYFWNGSSLRIPPLDRKIW